MSLQINPSKDTSSCTRQSWNPKRSYEDVEIFNTGINYLSDVVENCRIKIAKDEQL